MVVVSRHFRQCLRQESVGPVLAATTRIALGDRLRSMRPWSQIQPKLTRPLTAPPLVNLVLVFLLVPVLMQKGYLTLHRKRADQG